MRKKRINMKVILEGESEGRYYGICTTIKTRSLKGAERNVRYYRRNLEKEGIAIGSIAQAW